MRAIVFIAFAASIANAGPFLVTDGPQFVANAGVAAPARPVLTYYVADGDWCAPCNTAKQELKSAKNLPFDIAFSTKHPSWVTTLPTARWETDHDGPRQHVGWPGVAKLVELFERSRSTVSAEASPTPYSEVERVLALLPKPEIGFVDFGCGDGRWCIAAAERWGCRVTGVEINPARASATRERVRASRLSHLVTIITGDVLTTDVQADIGVAYLYEDVLTRLRPRLERLRAFASFIHRPPGLPVVQSGDSWIYTRQAVATQRPAAVWGGQLYSQPMCDNPRCGMCNSIRSQLGR